MGKCHGTSPVYILGVEAGMCSESNVITVKDGRSAFCVVLGFEDDEGAAAAEAKTWSRVMEQLRGVNVGTFCAADEAGIWRC